MHAPRYDAITLGAIRPSISSCFFFLFLLLFGVRRKWIVKEEGNGQQEWLTLALAGGIFQSSRQGAGLH